MPGLRGKKNVGRNIREFTKGKTFKKTAAKKGRKRALRQAIAVGLRQSGVPRKKARKKKR
jgi:hypothetical protein